MGAEEPGRGGSAERDVISFGSERPPRRPWVTGALIAAAVIAVAAVAVSHASHHGPEPAKHVKPPQVIVSYVQRHLLGVTGNWELFARGLGDLIRIQFDSGRITRTVVPPLLSNNPEVAFLVGPHEVVIRSYDEVPGYIVRDGDPALPLTGVLAADSPGPLLPGPQASQAWILEAGPGWQKLVLVGLDGRLTGTSIRLPPGGPLPDTAIADGRGYALLMTTANHIYDAGPTWDRLVPTLAVAVGPTGLLSLACHRGRCRDVVTSAATGAQRTLPGPGLEDPAFTWPTLGVIAPDDGFAAVPVFGTSPSGGGVTIKLVNLHTGSSTQLGIAMNPAPGYQFMAWSPDSQWLFVVAEDGQIVAVRARTGQTTSLGVRLPPVSQVAMRS